MSASNRAKKIAKLHSVLKKHYQPVKAPTRSILEHIVYACCLEDSKFDHANDAFARLQEIYTGWNEIRVTTVAELAEEMSELSQPQLAAERVKRTLYGLFESQYSWDFDHLRKENLGKATQKLTAIKSITPFVLSYVVQQGFGGHSVPIDQSAMEVMKILDIVSSKEAEKGSVPGLERAIPKSAGADFGSLLHQFAVDFAATPFSNSLRGILLNIDPECKDRFPKRQTKKKKAEPQAADAAEGTEEDSTADQATATKKSTAKPKSTEKKVAKKTAAKKTTTKKAAAKKAPSSPTASRKTTKKKSVNKKLAKRKPR